MRQDKTSAILFFVAFFAMFFGLGAAAVWSYTSFTVPHPNANRKMIADENSIR